MTDATSAPSHHRPRTAWRTVIHAIGVPGKTTTPSVLEGAVAVRGQDKGPLPPKKLAGATWLRATRKTAPRRPGGRRNHLVQQGESPLNGGECTRRPGRLWPDPHRERRAFDLPGVLARPADDLPHRPATIAAAPEDKHRRSTGGALLDAGSPAHGRSIGMVRRGTEPVVPRTLQIN
jgi:hypothetical protein